MIKAVPTDAFTRHAPGNPSQVDKVKTREMLQSPHLEPPRQINCPGQNQWAERLKVLGAVCAGSSPAEGATISWR